MKSTLRRLLSRTYMQTVSAATSWMQRNGVCVLGYHSIDGYESSLCVAPDEFDWQLRYIKSKGFKTLTIAEYADIILQGKSVYNCVLITFDDGYKDFLEHAVPLLKKYDCRATVFVVPDHVGRTPQWLVRDQVRINQLIDSFPFPEKSRADLLRWNEHFTSRPLMNWSELKSITELGVDVQSHSQAHHFLTELSQEALLTDLLRSREQIESELKKPVISIAYPYGDCDQNVADAAKQAGYKIGFLATPAGWKSSHQIGRTQIGGEDKSLILKYTLSSRGFL